MFGMNVTGASASIISLWIFATPDHKELSLVIQENIANPLLWSLLIKPDVLQVTYRIRKYVLNGNVEEAQRLKDSFKDTFALQAVPAAIIAQIAITMPGLSDFGNIHWTATAFAYTSLVSGLLSTFFTFYVQQILSNLHRPADIRKWLTSPRGNVTNRFINTIFRRRKSQREKHAANSDERIPSLTAAAILTAPSRLLTFSILSLFVALGIYLGSMYTTGLGTLKGSNANLAVLLFFIIFSVWAFYEVYIPLHGRLVDQFTTSLVRDEEERGFQLQDLGNDRQNTGRATAVASSEAPETKDIIREALKASIRAQEESLKAQQAFLELLDSQFRVASLNGTAPRVESVL